MDGRTIHYEEGPESAFKMTVYMQEKHEIVGYFEFSGYLVQDV